MKNFMDLKNIFSLQWRWILVSICFFSLYHISFQFFLELQYLFGKSVWVQPSIAGLFLFFVSLYLNYRAKKIIAFECGIASILYIIVIRRIFPEYLMRPDFLLNNYLLIECAIVGFAFAFAGAGIGWWIRNVRNAPHPIA
jgi:hypothetical protein